MAKFELSLAKVLRNEGVFSNDPTDNGGMTYKGIASRMHPDWAGWTIIHASLKAKDFPRCLEADAKLQSLVSSFYRFAFWSKISGDALTSQQIADDLFDYAVNTGLSPAIKAVQASVDMPQTGTMDTRTINALNSVE